jgi:hypothetical protein
MSVSVAACPRNQLMECQPRDNSDAFKPTLFYNFFHILGLIVCIVFAGVMPGLPQLLGR